MKTAVIAAIASLVAAASARADEGMWTPDHLPMKHLSERYHFSPDALWIEHAQKSAARIVGHGCSASFISATGLLLTNHHCIVSCLRDLSSTSKDLIGDGFYAKELNDEIKCPGSELQRLDGIVDVTDRVKKAARNKTGEALTQAEATEIAAIEKECTASHEAAVHCQVVNLYHGGVYSLYKYHRYPELRLVFAPENAVAEFGGDPDNFNFPRYGFDMSLMRAYENGAPAHVSNYFRFSRKGADVNEMTVTVGNPASTERELTVAQLVTERDVDIYRDILRLTELRGVLEQFRTESPQRARETQANLLGIGNALKLDKGRFEALQDPQVLAEKRQQENELHSFVDADPKLKRDIGSAWDEIARAMETYRALQAPYYFIEENPLESVYFYFARQIVRGAQERTKPDAERLPEFTDARLPGITEGLFLDERLDPDLEKVAIVLSMTQMRESLGADNPLVRKVLGNQSPLAMADALLASTKVGEASVRKALWEGGVDAVAKSDDPFIVLARTIDGDARAIRKRLESDVKAVVDRNSELIAAARFDKYGTALYPDATGTQRFSFGEARGWQDEGATIEPFTDYAGLFARNTAFEPYNLPAVWLREKQRINQAQHFNFVTTNDTYSGNSGSPVLNRRGEIVGLMFDINIHALGGRFEYDEHLNRTVAVDANAILEGLTHVYKVQRITNEISHAQ